MADTLGQADLRGLNVDKLVKGFADQMFVFKKYFANSSTSAREIRWYRKTSGVLDSTDTTGITTTKIINAFGTLPPIAEQSATRHTSYVKHFSIESPWFTYADIRDTDPDMLAINIRDLTRAVQNQVDYRIFDVLSGAVELSGSAAGTGWSDASNGNPILDLLSGSTEIEKANYDVSNLVVLMHPNQKRDMLNYIISTKGSSIPNFSSQKVKDGALMSIVGQRVVVSPNVTSGVVMQIIPQKAGTWKSFTPISSVVKEEPGVGKKVRIWEDGEIIITDPSAAFMTTGA